VATGVRFPLAMLLDHVGRLFWKNGRQGEDAQVKVDLKANNIRNKSERKRPLRKRSEEGLLLVEKEFVRSVRAATRRDIGRGWGT